MRLGALLAVAALVLVTLVTAFPQTFRSEQDSRSNIQDHMVFTKELAKQEAQVSALERQHAAMANLPERMARIEERLDIMGKMLFAALAGILALIGKEAWYTIRSLHPKRAESTD